MKSWRNFWRSSGCAACFVCGAADFAAFVCAEAAAKDASDKRDAKRERRTKFFMWLPGQIKGTCAPKKNGVGMVNAAAFGFVPAAIFSKLFGGANCCNLRRFS